jgi:hypothetical protein
MFDPKSVGGAVLKSYSAPKITTFSSEEADAKLLCEILLGNAATEILAMALSLKSGKSSKPSFPFGGV